MNFLKKIRPFDQREEMDPLLALQRLEDEEQTQEQEFFRITEHISEIGTEKTELEVKLPKLLKTKRERALYNALMLIIKAKRERFSHYEKRVGSLERVRV